MILTGELSLLVAFLMAAWTAIASCSGGATGRRALVASGERGVHATLGLLLVAAAGLLVALLTRDFSLRHVATLTSANLPTAYTIAALWAGRAGALLLWALLLAACTAVATHGSRRGTPALTPYVTGTLAAAMVIVIATLILAESPFGRLDWIPPDGQGMSPQLQNAGIAIHPPALYLGSASTAVAFAFAVAGLVTGHLSRDLLAAMRRWMLVAWFFTAVAMLIGMWWAYTQPDWTGHWALDPVRNAALFPWLVNTAFLLVVSVQERRGLVRKWNVSLVVTAFLLSLPAAFITRGGETWGLHEFAGSRLGTWLIALLLPAIAAATIAVARRLRDLEVSVPTEDAAVADRPLRTTGRYRRRHVGYAAALGFLALVAGLAGLAFSEDHHVLLRPGDAVELTDPFGARWRFVSEGVSRYDALNREAVAVTLAADREGQRAGLLTAERRQYVDSRGAPTFGPSSKPGILSSPWLEVYVVLIAIGEETTELRLRFNPLMWWVWVGGAVAAGGGLIALWPATRNGR